LKNVDVVVRKKNQPTKTLTIDAHTADVIRKIARADGMMLTDFLDQAVRDYIMRRHPQWTIVEDRVVERELTALPKARRRRRRG
jgi:hypothetical protein